SVALQIAKRNKNYFDSDVINLLKFAKYKIDVSVEECREAVKNMKRFERYVDNNVDESLEYINNIEIKIKKEQYLDFARSITPIVDLLFEKYVCSVLNYDLSKAVSNGKIYCNKLDEDIQDKMESKYGCLQNGVSLSYSHLYFIIQAKCRDKDVLRHCENLYVFTKEIRNVVAHNMQMLDEETIEYKTGVSLTKVFNSMQKLYLELNKNLNSNCFESYKLINEDLQKFLK
ncbi:MAG: hypothetical protein ACK5LV_01905, partial [Lachnospirales bacterium]